MRVILQCALAIAVLASLVAGAAYRASWAADHASAAEVWTTKKVMDKVHLGKQALLAVVNKDLRKAEPDWQSDEKNLTEIIRLMSQLTKQPPPRGSQEAWDKLVRDYVGGAKAARQHVQEHQRQQARAALEKVIATCDACHDNHGIQ
jgi:hypothetical protein